MQQTNPTAVKQEKIDTIAVFVDSTNFATPKSSKIWLASIVIDDSISKSYVRFYSKENNTWKLKYSFEDEHWSGHVIEPAIADFNNDGYKDFKYLKATGARGGNSINNLFLYDKKGDSLAYVLNSNEYPNLNYNKETNSIISYILTGSVETIFLRLDSNKLKPFASIDQYEREVTVTEYDKSGNSKVIHIDSSNKYKEFARFINFKPLKAEQ
ncbi:MAG: hypothetical protein EOP48_26105 [Sphingobacteriales bacterium]|nr:MAG: hypothetical protein EOP48_26105 [Sphingobacteriales bacterium]